MSEDNLTENLEAIDKVIKLEEAKIKRGKYLEQMIATEAFQEVVIKGYFEAEAKRLFEILVTPPGNRKDILDITHEKLSALRHFKEYIGTASYPGIVRREAENAPDRIETEEAYRKEITAEGVE